MIKLNKSHKGYEFYSGRSSTKLNRKSDIYTLEESTEFKDNEIIFTATLKINTDTKEGRKILRNMIEKQTSPIKIVLQSINSDDKSEIREGAPYKYTLPDEIIEELEKDREIKEFERY